MSIDLIANTGLSLLRSAQYQSQITSSNMANANTAGYSAKSVGQIATISDGVNTGVDTTKIKSTIDRHLQKQLALVTSELGFSTTLSDHLKAVNALFGNLGDKNSSLSTKIATFEAKLAALKNTPNSHENALQAVRALEDITHHLRGLSAGIQDQRSKVSDKIEGSTAQVNGILKEIHTLNQEISKLDAEGKSAADLEDQRRVNIEKLSRLMNISHFTNSENKTVITTQKGSLLLGNNPRTLSYSSPTTISHSAKYPASIPKIAIDGVDVTQEISGGKLGALIQLRDQDLVKKHDELDEFSRQLISKLNGLGPHGTAYPLQQEITGGKKLSAADALNMSGSFKVVLTDMQGKVQNVQSLNLSGVASVGALVGKINALSGIDAHLNADGELSIKAQSNSQRIALVPGDSKDTSTPPQNISHVTGLGSLLQGDGVHDIAVNKHLSKTPTLFPTSKVNLALGQPFGSAGNSETLTQLMNGLKSQKFNAAGDLKSGTRSFAQYGTRMLSLLADKTARVHQQVSVHQTVEKGLKSDISSTSAVNLNEEIAALAAHQKAFQVAGHIIKATQSMFDTLLRMSR